MEYLFLIHFISTIILAAALSIQEEDPGPAMFYGFLFFFLPVISQLALTGMNIETYRRNKKLKTL